MKKAYNGAATSAPLASVTARAFDLSTAELAEMAQPGGSLYGIAGSNDGRVIVFPGGIPLTDNDEIIGAIGVSGGEVDQDHAVAEAGVAALA